MTTACCPGYQCRAVIDHAPYLPAPDNSVINLVSGTEAELERLLVWEALDVAEVSTYAGSTGSTW